MHVIIEADQAEVWAEKVLKAIVRFRADSDEQVESFRKEFIARKNFWRKFNPFLKPLPADTEVDFDANWKYNSHHHWNESLNKSAIFQLECIYRSIRNLEATNDYKGLSLSEREVRLIGND